MAFVFAFEIMRRVALGAKRIACKFQPSGCKHHHHLAYSSIALVGANSQSYGGNNKFDVKVRIYTIIIKI